MTENKPRQLEVLYANIGDTARNIIESGGAIPNPLLGRDDARYVLSIDFPLTLDENPELMAYFERVVSLVLEYNQGFIPLPPDGLHITALEAIFEQKPRTEADLTAAKVADYYHILRSNLPSLNRVSAEFVGIMLTPDPPYMTIPNRDNLHSLTTGLSGLNPYRRIFADNQLPPNQLRSISLVAAFTCPDGSIPNTRKEIANTLTNAGKKVHKVRDVILLTLGRFDEPPTSPIVSLIDAINDNPPEITKFTTNNLTLISTTRRSVLLPNGHITIDPAISLDSNNRTDTKIKFVKPSPRRT